MENIPARSERAGRLCRISSVISSITAKRARPVGRALCLRFAKEPFLQVLLVALDHLLDRVTRTTSEILEDFIGCFPRKDLDLQGH
mgnify:CR=1 FL=1